MVFGRQLQGEISGKEIRGAQAHLQMDHVVAAQQKVVLELVVAQVGEPQPNRSIKVKWAAQVAGNAQEVLAKREVAVHEFGIGQRDPAKI